MSIGFLWLNHSRESESSTELWFSCFRILLKIRGFYSFVIATGVFRIILFRRLVLFFWSGKQFLFFAGKPGIFHKWEYVEGKELSHSEDFFQVLFLKKQYKGFF